jgi:hypothetical protein
MLKRYKVIYREKGSWPNTAGVYIFDATSEKDARRQWNEMKKNSTLMFTNCKIAWVELYDTTREQL